MSNPGKEYSRISFLFEKYMKATCSKPEAREIVDIFEDSGNDNLLKGASENQWNTIVAAHNDDLDPTDTRLITDRILDRLHHQIRLHEEGISGKYFLQKKAFAIFTKVAAVFILPLSIYSIYLTTRIPKTLPAEANQIVWQTIKAPVGTKADFLLPDGSHVWLNSGSVFKYPVSFAKDKRQVEMIGEAFFDVFKDASHPFLVKAGKMNIAVKGTRFNVTNYADEVNTELILESGSVQLFSGDYNENNIVANIVPGERAILDVARNALSVSNVDVSKYTSWKEGLLIFKDDQMDEVVRKLNRWFNVDIVLESPELKEYVYTATYRNETLPQILELLKISAPIKYTITDRERLDDNTYSKRKIVITKRI